MNRVHSVAPGLRFLLARAPAGHLPAAASRRARCPAFPLVAQQAALPQPESFFSHSLGRARSFMSSAAATASESGHQAHSHAHAHAHAHHSHGHHSSGRRGRLRGIVFDMDGTLTLDGAIDFQEMRRRAKIPPGQDILGHIATLPEAERLEAEQAIAEVEREGYERIALNKGCLEALQALRGKGLKLAILTRNTDEAVTVFLDRFGLHQHFDMTVSRDWKGKPKPHPDALFHISQTWGFPPGEMMMVGDWVDDVNAGLNAGCHTAILRLEKNTDHLHLAHHTLDLLNHIVEVVDSHYEIISIDTPNAGTEEK